MLAAAGLEGRVFITNTVFWRPPGNRTPSPDEQMACAPFLERGVTTFATSATRGRPLDSKAQTNQRWPQGLADGQVIDLSSVRSIRAGGEVNNYLVDRSSRFGYFAAFNPKLSLIFGYVFLAEQFPWLNVWESYTPELFTRGMEFSNTPIHGTARALVSQPSLWDVPTFEWLDAKGSIHKRFAAFIAHSAPSFRGVHDVRVEGSKLRVIDVGGGPSIEIDLGHAF